MLDREQLEAASVAERERALRSEQQAVLREAARVAREAALAGDASRAAALRLKLLPLLPEKPELDRAPVEGVVIND